MALAWPMVGRDDELRRAGTLLGRDDVAGLVLVGAAGVGKTRFAREALRAARKRGVGVHWATATTSARELPLGAFASLLGPVDGDPVHLFQRATSALLSRAGARGVVVGVDDGHLLDGASASLLHQLVLRRAVRLVVTVRSGEPAPDAVTALWKDEHLERVDLPPLAAGTTADLLEAGLGGPVETPTAQRLWSITRGNPMYLRQLVDGEREAGRLSCVTGMWRWSGDPELPPGLIELVAHRMGALSRSECDVLDVLALAEPLGVDLLAGLVAARAVERAEARGLVELVTSGRRVEARLAHPLYGEVRRAQCGRLRARRLRGEVAGALARTGARRSDDMLRQAVLAVDSDLPPDAELLGAAGQRALDLGDCALAERLAAAAIAAGGGFASRMTLVWALCYTGRSQDVGTWLAELAASATTDEERVGVATLLAVGLFWDTDARERAEAVLADALAALTDEAFRTQLVATRATFDVYNGLTERAHGAAVTLLADPCLPTDSLVVATWALAVAEGDRGRLGGLAAAVARSDAAPGAWYVGSLRLGNVTEAWARALRLAGHLDDAAAMLTARRDLVTAQSNARGAVVGAMAQVDRDRGRLDTAVRGLREAAAVPRTAAWQNSMLVDLVGTLAMTGDAAAASALLATVDDGRRVLFDTDLLLARAWTAAAAGATSVGREHARAAARLASARGQPAVAVSALHTAVQFGDRTVAAELAALATEVDGPRAPAAAAHAAALAVDDGAGLLDAAERLEAFGALLLAADAAAQAAEAFLRSGRNGSSHEAAGRAGRLLGLCESGGTPALRALGRPLPLTAREREIVMLAATGHTNRQIAEQLVVSVRTVEGHLYRACGKLGVRGRAELATLLPGDLGTPRAARARRGVARAR